MNFHNTLIIGDSMELNQAQKDVVSKCYKVLVENNFVLLDFNCRTGKTRAALSLVSGNVLFVTKKNAIGSILSDLEDFPDLNCLVINQEGLNRVDSALAFDFVVVDECHAGFSSYPKTSKRWKQLKGLIGKAKVVFMSATPAIESRCQFYHIFKLCHYSPWKSFGSFYKWHKEYGIPSTIRISGGQTVQDYSKGRDEMIMGVVNKYSVHFTQEEAGFSQKSEIVVHELENIDLDFLSKQFKKDKVLQIDGHLIMGDTPASLNQKLHMIEGGTLKDSDGEAFILPECYDPFYKCDYIRKRLKNGRKVAIFTQYIKERELISDYFGCRITTDMVEFKESEIDLWVGSIQSYSEGFDLSWMNGSMILYSLNYRGSTFLQVINRMANYNRVDPIKVHVLLHGFDFHVYKMVSEKNNFDGRVLND